MNNINDDEYIAKLIEEELWLNEFQSNDTFYTETDIELQLHTQPTQVIADEIKRDYEKQLEKEHLEQQESDRKKREQENTERRQMIEEQDRLYKEMKDLSHHPISYVLLQIVL